MRSPNFVYCKGRADFLSSDAERRRFSPVEVIDIRLGMDTSRFDAGIGCIRRALEALVAGELWLFELEMAAARALREIYAAADAARLELGLRLPEILDVEIRVKPA